MKTRLVELTNRTAVLTDAWLAGGRQDDALDRPEVAW